MFFLSYLRTQAGNLTKNLATFKKWMGLRILILVWGEGLDSLYI